MTALSEDAPIPTLYSFEQTMALLQVSRSTLHAKTGGDAPLWPSRKVGRQRLFTAQDINEILELSRVAAVPAAPRPQSRTARRRETIDRARSGMRSVS